MGKVKNPFLSLNNYYCFACSPHNEHGLQLEFFEGKDEVTTSFKTKRQFEGFPGMLHGGIAGTVLDEIMFWACFAKTQIMTVTMSLEIKYRLPLKLDREYKARGKVLEVKRRSIFCEASIEDTQEKVYCFANGIYFIPEKKKFSKSADIDVEKGPLSEYFK
ncbi:PaaI family thioesterase [candidate division WOR-3 bacterium]|nr:PaaI family thioesterase [candidate division WOR-3 bacterium]